MESSKKNYFDYIIYSNWSLYIFLAIISIYYTGYNPSINGVDFITAVKQSIDPTLLKNDLVFSNINAVGRILLIKLTVFLSWFFSLKDIVFYYFVLSRILLVGGLYTLGFTLTKDKKIALLTVLSIFILDSIRIPLSVSVFTLNSFYTKFLAVPILLFAIAYFIDNKYYLSFFILGIATYCHFLVSTQVFIILAFYCFLNLKKLGLKTVIYCFIIYFLIACPEIINAFKTPIKNLTEDSISNKEFIQIIGYIRAPHHLIPSMWPIELYLRFFMYIIAGTYSYLYLEKNKALLKGFQICIITAIICILFFPFIYLSPSIMLYHPFRMTKWLFAIEVVFIIAFLFQSFNTNSKGMMIWSVMTLAFINNPIIVFLLFIIRILYEIFQHHRKTNAIFIVLNLGILLLLCLIPVQHKYFYFPPNKYNFSAINLMITNPVKSMGNYIFFFIVLFGITKIIFRYNLKVFKNINLIILLLSSFLLSTTIIDYAFDGKIKFVKRFQPKVYFLNQDFIDLCSWIKKNSERDDIVITSPSLRDLRHFTDRAILANIYYIPITRDSVKEWYNRLNILSNGELNRYHKKLLSKRNYDTGNYLKNILNNGYLSLTSDNFFEIGEKYNCSFVVTSHKQKLSLKRLFYNSTYNVYSLNEFVISNN